MGMIEAQGQMRRHVQREPGAAELRFRQPERSLGRRHHLRQGCAWVGVPCRSRVIDRGVQYSSMGYRTMLSENGITPSLSAPGCPYDNACTESFFASFKKELAYRCDFKDIEEVREAVFRYIELFYNRKRLHSSLGYMTPVEYRLSKQAA